MEQEFRITQIGKNKSALIDLRRKSLVEQETISQENTVKSKKKEKNKFKKFKNELDIKDLYTNKVKFDQLTSILEK